jgi:hypothetical protein
VVAAAVERHLGQPDQAVVVGVPAVDHRRLPCVGALEEEEVVADEFHLVEGLVDGHRGGGMVLLPHDPAGQVLVQIRDVRALGQLTVEVQGAGPEVGGAGVVAHPDAGRRAAPVVHPAAIGRAAQAVVQLGRREIQCGVEVGAVGLGPDDGTLAPQRDLHALAAGRLAGVLLVEELHVDA